MIAERCFASAPLVLAVVAVAIAPLANGGNRIVVGDASALRSITRIPASWQN